MNAIRSDDCSAHVVASTDFASPVFGLQGMFECLDAAGIDGRLADRHIEAPSIAEPARPGAARRA